MKTRYVHACQECGADSWTFTEQHQVNQKYQWVRDHCGVQAELIFSSEGRAVTQAPTSKRCERTSALFTFDNDKRMAFLYEGCRWTGTDDDSVLYYYHEHTCPTNLLRCEEIFFEGRLDTHGLFTLVKEIVVTGPNAVDRDVADDELRALAIEITSAPLYRSTDKVGEN